jgi:Dockerin type I domain
MQKGFWLGLIVGVALSLSSTSAQLISRGQALPDQIAPHGMPVNKSTWAFDAAAHQGLLAAASQPGDLDGDGDVDNDDLNLLLAELNTPVSGSTCGVRCDLNGDAVINALDARQLVALCTRPRCATT